MKRMQINFAPRSFTRTVRATSALTWILIAIGIALCAAVAISASALLQDYDRQNRDLTNKQASLAERTAGKAVSKKITVSDAQATAGNNAIAQLNIPWRDLFDAIESATPATVALLTLEPDAKKHVIKGSAETKSSDNMIAYIEQLKQQHFFNMVVLTKHEINELDPNRPIRFQFEAQYAEVAR